MIITHLGTSLIATYVAAAADISASVDAASVILQVDGT